MLAIIIALFAVIADQVSKYIVVENLELYGSAPFIPKVMSFYHTRNTGAAFSMLSDKPWIFMVVSVIAMAVIIYLLYSEYKRHLLLTISLSMVLGGAIGNMIDRFRLGYVVDFFHVDFFDFAVFNVADCLITVGAVLLGVYVVFFETKVEKRILAEKQAKEAALAECAAETPAEAEASVDTADATTESHADKESENG